MPASCQVSCNAFTGTAVYVWQPGYLSGSTQTLNSSTTIYTINAQLGSCIASQTYALNNSTACCSSTLNPFMGTVLSNTSYTGTNSFNNNVTVPPGVITVLRDNVLFAPNVKVTVSNSATLQLTDVHLYGCLDMWQGIEVKDGGKVLTFIENTDNLIEDAIIAIDASNQYTTTVHPFIDVSRTTFNKNYIDINVTNYQRYSPTYTNALSIHSCVFTCRNLTFTNTAWPQTGTSSSVTTFSADLRFATSSPTAMAAPYLGQAGFSVTTLKSPYSSLYSQSAIKLTNVGGSSFAVYYPVVIGDGGNSVNFNVFDSHNIFIDGHNSDIYSHNNVFQNTLFESSPGVGIKTLNDYSNSGIFEGVLDLVSSTSPSVIINRFYDCHVGIQAGNLGWLNVQYDEFKSTQSSSNTISPSNPGYFGIHIVSNRYRNYIVDNCKFYNINNGIYAGATIDNLAPFISPAFGQVWGTFNITNNLFSPSITSTINTEFINNGVVIEDVLFVQTPSSTATPGNYVFVSPLNGLQIKTNNFDRVWRGVTVSNFNSSLFSHTTANNTISIVADANTSNPQWGVKYLNNTAATVNSNTITGFTTSTATAMQGVYTAFSTNSGVQCNSLIALPVGAQFSGNNSGMQWRKNAMNNNGYGLLLANSGIIGQQGYINGPNDNIWQGTWSGSNYNTFTDNSMAANSALFCRPNYTSTISYYPNNNSGLIGANTYSATGGLFVALSSSAIPDCITTKPGRGKDWNGTKGAQAVAIAARLFTYTNYSDTTTEINDILLYRDLLQDTTLRESSDTLLDFYDANSSTALGILMRIEELFSQGDISSASSALSSFTATTAIQTNYKEFYELYAAYTSSTGLTTTQITNLEDLANKCPFIDGPIVYNARALYNIASRTVVIYNDDGCESGTGARTVNTQHANTNLISGKNPIDLNRNYKLYPNPAIDKLYIFGDTENEKINLIVNDVDGKQLVSKALTIADYHTELKLDLLNGVYFVTLINKNNERVIKKLVIAK